MVPLVSDARELQIIRADALRVIRETSAELGAEVPDVPIGAMLETPRACLLAGDIAVHADFFSFGTNDLTQLTWGFSRDDSATFLPAYLEQGVMSVDPFQTVDAQGVHELVTCAIERARRVRPSVTIGVCGEHGGDPASIATFARTSIDYVSCSPPRVPTARLAAAHAAIGGRVSRPRCGRGCRQPTAS